MANAPKKHYTPEMLIDDIIIKIASGKGGAGVVAFDKNKMALGPTGGNGGRGGSVYFEGVSDLGALSQFRFKKELFAEDGGNGRGQFVDGKDGQDAVLKVPVGTVIRNLDTGEEREIVRIGEKILAAAGGRGGKGNYKFRSPTDTSPKKFQPGLPGESFGIRLELKLIADVGLVGLPNAGKSSLLNALTSAESKVANYPFTTLEPNLGIYYELVLADIPGLIEGASSGKGLGIKFLRHIERTKIIFHLVSAESEDPVQDYRTVRKEIESYGGELTKKRELAFLSKSDLVAPDELRHKLAALRKVFPDAVAISVENGQGMMGVKKILNNIAKEKHK